MEKNLMSVLESHEMEDAYRLKYQPELVDKEEFAADSLKGIRTLLELPEEFAETGIYCAKTTPHVLRVSNRFYIRKHTRAIAPYFHQHDFIEMIYVRKGRCVQFIEDLDHPLILGEGQLALLGTGTVHALLAGRPQDLIFKFVIPADFLRDIFQDETAEQHPLIRLWKESGDASGQGRHYMVFDPANKKKVDAMIQIMLQEHFFGSTGNQTALRGYLSLLLVELIRDTAPYEYSFRQEKPAALPIYTVLEYMQQHKGCVTLEEMAAYFHYHPSYLSRQIREYTGKTFRQLMKEQRMETAEKMLVSTQLPIDEIAEKTGFKRSNRFYELFKKETGLTPQQYRKQNQKKGVSMS